ncbi:MAG: hypothetical protein NVS1B14_03350 [Vulcanimicrobiaceae bacterium]
MAIAGGKIRAAIEELIADYELDPQTLIIVGGGGGAASLVPYAAKQGNYAFRLARDAEVISPLGVALALVRDVVERTIVNPAPEDIVRIRREAQDAVIAGGAAPETIDVAIEIDAQRNLVRATASGASALAQSSSLGNRSAEEQLQIAAALMRSEPAAVRRIELTDGLSAFTAERRVPQRFGRARAVRELRILDRTGVARAALRDANVTRSDAESAPAVLQETLEAQTSFGDDGRALPTIYVVHGARIADLSGLANAGQVVALATEELRGLAPESPVGIVTAKNRA